jgi:hypothetical protein
MGSDAVTSIDDTAESLQIVDLVRTLYEEWTTRDDWPFEKKLIKIQALSDVTKPNYLKLQDDVAELDRSMEIRYEITADPADPREYKQLEYKCPEEFIRLTLTKDTTDTTNIQEVEDFSGIDLFIEKTKNPEFWTSFDDKYIVFDSYNEDLDATLQESKTMAFAIVYPGWTTQNTFIPEMPAKMFPAFLAEVKANAFLYFKDQLSPGDEKRALRGMSFLRRKAGRTNNETPKNKYGRR